MKELFKTGILKKLKREISLFGLKLFAKKEVKAQKLETAVERESQKVRLLQLKLRKKQLKQKKRKLKRKLRES